MKELHYERLNQLIVVSDYDNNNLPDGIIEQMTVPSDQYQILYSDYVKSQIHLNVVSRLFNRSLADYVKAFYFLQGSKEHLEEAQIVLRYFYTDMANFLVHNPTDVKLFLKVDADLGEDFSVELKSIQHRIANSGLSSRAANNSQVTLTEFERDLSILIKRAEDLDTKPSSCTLAYVLTKVLQKEGCTKLILEGGYDE